MGASDTGTVPFDQHDSLRNGNSSGISRLDFRFGSCLENVPFTRSLMENIVNSDRLVILVFSFYGYTVCEKYPLYVTGLSDLVSFSCLGNRFFMEEIQRQKKNSSGSDFRFGCGRSLFMGISLRQNHLSTLAITASVPFETDIRVQQNTVIDRLLIPHAANYTFSDSTLRIAIVHPDGTILTQVETSIQAGTKDQAIDLSLPAAVLLPAENYRLLLSIPQGNGITLRRNILANENWDEGLPFPLYGKDPFGQLYTGITNEIRWPDSENKKEMLLDVLDQADYIILPSQRGIWSSERIPLTYPMTIDYYESLFDGSLGFELAAQFQRPFKLGPLYFSDLTGKFYWNQAPVLPVKNLSPFAAEEAFSVYDHPPVWIFRKTADFDLSKAKAILDRADLSKVIVQGPTEAVWPEGYADSEE